MHTAIAAVMELVNDAYRLKDDLYGARRARPPALRNRHRGVPDLPVRAASGSRGLRGAQRRRVWETPWPKADPALLDSDTVTLVVQVNGKRRDEIEAAADAPRGGVARAGARERAASQRQIDGREVVKEIVVPGRLINLVVKVSSASAPAGPTGPARSATTIACWSGSSATRRRSMSIAFALTSSWTRASSARGTSP